MLVKILPFLAVLAVFGSPAWADPVEDFYKNKTVRIVVGFGPGGATDTNARLVASVLSKYIPGNPRVVVQNRPGAGSLLAANTVYNNEPQDGTVIGAFSSDLALAQARGEPGVHFDATKYQWIASGYDTAAMCAVRTDAGVSGIEDVMGPDGKEIVFASFGKGGLSHIPAAVFNEVFGTRFKVVTGYPGGAAQRLAVKNNEVQGFCTTFQTIQGTEAGMFEGPAACCKVLIIAGAEEQDHPFLEGVPVAEQLAKKMGKSEEDIAMLRAMNAPNRISIPQAVAPGVPEERVEALRRAFEQAYKDPELLKLAGKMGLDLNPKTGEQVQVIVTELLDTPQPVLERLSAAVQ